MGTVRGSRPSRKSAIVSLLLSTVVLFLSILVISLTLGGGTGKTFLLTVGIVMILIGLYFMVGGFKDIIKVFRS